jgi:hypothetical protein
MENDAVFCTNCGKRLDEATGGTTTTSNTQQAAPPAQPITPQANTYPYGQPSSNTHYTAPPQSKTNGLAIAGFITSLVSLFFNLFTFGILGVVGIVLSAVGINMAKKPEYNSGKGLGIAGVVIGIVGILFIILILVAVISYPSFWDYYYYYY